MSEIIVNASGVERDSLNWLMKADDGHYFIEQKRNTEGSHSHYHPVSESLAKKIIASDIETAWGIMNRYVANDI